MNITTLTISGKEADHKARIYGDIPASRRTEEDELLLSIYRAAGKGKRILDVARAFRDTGLHPTNGYPKLAITRADFSTVFFHPRRTLDSSWWTGGAGGFSPKRDWDQRATRMNFALPMGTFDDDHLVRGQRLRSPVPHVPPELRPQGGLDTYHILFEAEWKAYPVDPFLLRHVTGMLFVVEAEWELTELEATLLGAMHATEVSG